MKKKTLVYCLIALCSGKAFAASDTGKVVEIYNHPNGKMALRLDGGLPNSNAANNCGVAGNEWAGVEATAAPALKAAILTAKVMGYPVLLVTFGACVDGWIKIEAMHVR